MRILVLSCAEDEFAEAVDHYRSLGVGLLGSGRVNLLKRNGS